MNKSNLSLALSFVGVLAVAVGLFFGFGKTEVIERQTEIVPQSFGAIERNSTTLTNPHIFQQTVTTERFVTGGERLATSTNGAGDTLTGSQIRDYSFVDYTVGRTAGVTLTLQATSSWPTTLIPNTGDEITLFVRSATSTGAGVPLTLAAGTGVLFRNSTSTAVMGELDGAFIRLVRLANTDVMALLEFFQ